MNKSDWIALGALLLSMLSFIFKMRQRDEEGERQLEGRVAVLEGRADNIRDELAAHEEYISGRYNSMIEDSRCMGATQARLEALEKSVNDLKREFTENTSKLLEQVGQINVTMMRVTTLVEGHEKIINNGGKNNVAKA